MLRWTTSFQETALPMEEPGNVGPAFPVVIPIGGGQPTNRMAFEGLPKGAAAVAEPRSAEEVNSEEPLPVENNATGESLAAMWKQLGDVAKLRLVLAGRRRELARRSLHALSGSTWAGLPPAGPGNG
eukprot:CAMPEP_0206613452 /NCGR_PEP_ID=MMETSP0325_2-20121206/56712_1 /ASSEMBLY_ACC=CAM_ASM_000347 /TAXON_ID=2866 /ORGANISM="Crypthecodinium cohnii, Strain Seligo" /LENGTH=126 /DNA_ID=CAMNT_0054133575 /DNA_START=69 /DNA_END=445 /DNA_ORIENTATION=-